MDYENHECYQYPLTKLEMLTEKHSSLKVSKTDALNKLKLISADLVEVESEIGVIVNKNKSVTNGRL